MRRKVVEGICLVVLGVALSGYVNVVFIPNLPGSCNPGYLGPPPNEGVYRSCPLPVSSLDFILVSNVTMVGILILGGYSLVKGLRPVSAAKADA